jgi:hypothetical protein
MQDTSILDFVAYSFNSGTEHTASVCIAECIQLYSTSSHRVLVSSTEHRGSVRSNERRALFDLIASNMHVSIRQHTSAYVSIRQHTSAYVSILTSAYVSIRHHTSASRRLQDAGAHLETYVSIRQHTRAHGSIRQHLVAFKMQERIWKLRQHTSTYVSIRQHTSAYVSIRQHPSAHVSTSSPPRWRSVSGNMPATSLTTLSTTSNVESEACGVSAVGITGLSGSGQAVDGQISGCPSHLRLAYRFS